MNDWFTRGVKHGDTDFMFYRFPLRIVCGDGSPVRAVAVVKDEPAVLGMNS